MPIIFDEVNHVEKMLDNGFQTNNNKFELQLLANYFRLHNFSDSDIEIELHNFCKKYVQNYNKVKFYKLIDEKVERSKKSKMKLSIPVNITQSEMDTILNEPNYKCQKLMFVYLVLAKYYMSNNHTDKYYVGCKDNDIFNLCEMYIRKCDKMDLMHYLTKQGYITPTLSMSSIINYVNEDSEPVITLVPNIDMVYYFEKYLGGYFTTCACCGLLTKRKSNRTKYCSICLEKIKRGEIDRVE